MIEISKYLDLLFYDVWGDYHFKFLPQSTFPNHLYDSRVEFFERIIAFGDERFREPTGIRDRHAFSRFPPFDHFVECPSKSVVSEESPRTTECVPQNADEAAR